MRDRQSYFMCFPSVVCTEKETTVCIAPRDNSRRFFEEKEYEVSVFGLEDDEESYYIPLDFSRPCTVKNGCLWFTGTFSMEQEYEVRFRVKGEKPLESVFFYAVAEDLYRLRPLKGDFHCHTYYSDARDGITMTPADYREEGFDFCAITDHNRRYTSTLASDLYEDVDLGMHILPGEEIHTPGSCVHIVHVGGSDSVADRYVHHTDEYYAEVDAVEKTIPDSIPERYRRRYAMAKWACEKIHECNGLAIFPHPYWKPRKYNVGDEFSNLLLDAKMFDAFELLGCVGDRLCNLQVGLWQQRLVQGDDLPIVGSSDSHNHNTTHDPFARRFTLVFAEANTTESILDAVRKGNTVAGYLPKGETVLGEIPFNNGMVQFYGSQFRLVKFAHFLYQNYFAETYRLCFCEGVLMRRYAEGEEVGEVLSALAPTVENFYKKFYGFVPYEGIPKRAEAFLNKAREVQKQGPVTPGPRIEGTGRRE